MEFLIEKKIDCSKLKPYQCSDLIVEKLIPHGIKLRASKETDKVNGHLRIDHNIKKHKIYVTIYEKNEKSNAQHLTTFEKPKHFLTLEEIKKIIKEE